MGLAQESIVEIQALIHKAIDEHPAALHANVRYELELRERVIRVEEELKHQRELMIASFERMDKRFEQVDRHFEQIDRHFEQAREETNRRFEQVDKRFEEARDDTNRRFKEASEESNKRFDLQHEEIKGLHLDIKDIRQDIKLSTRWILGVMLTLGGLIIAVLRLG